VQVGNNAVSSTTLKVPPAPVSWPLTATIPSPVAGTTARVRIATVGVPTASPASAAAPTGESRYDTAGTADSPEFQIPAAADGAQLTNGDYIVGPLPAPPPMIVAPMVMASVRAAGLDYNQPPRPQTLQQSFRLAGADTKYGAAASSCKESGGSLC